MREKLRRMSCIVYMLQIKPHSIEQITARVNYITGMNYHRSSIEKDIAMLRDDFDCPIEKNEQKRLVILEEYSYTAKIIQWIEFYQ
jgi:hypothetical protein